MMRIWGILSRDDESAGFDLLLDERWRVLLLFHGTVVARFDPRDYTLAELSGEVREAIEDTIMNKAPQDRIA